MEAKRESVAPGWWTAALGRLDQSRRPARGLPAPGLVLLTQLPSAQMDQVEATGTAGTAAPDVFLAGGDSGVPVALTGVSKPSAVAERPCGATAPADQAELLTAPQFSPPAEWWESLLRTHHIAIPELLRRVLSLIS